MPAMDQLNYTWKYLLLHKYDMLLIDSRPVVTNTLLGRDKFSLFYFVLHEKQSEHGQLDCRR